MANADGMGRDIERLRYELNMSQAEFARHFGTSMMSVSRWERGKCPAPASALLAMAKIAPNKQAAWRFLKHVGLTRAEVEGMLRGSRS